MRAHVSLMIGVFVVSLAGASAADEWNNEETHYPPPPAPASTAKTTVTVETTPTPTPTPTPPQPAPIVDRPSEPVAPQSLADQRLLTGFRLGYLYVFDHKKQIDALGGQSLSERTGMRSPHQFLIGYEAFYRMLGHSQLNVLLVGNVMVSGLEQSRFYPSANGLIGFEFRNSFQLGVGVHLTPLKESAAHTIVAAGWTPRSGSFYVPIHAFFVPDVDGNHRVGVTTGVTF